MHRGELQTEGVALHPANLRLIDPQRPAEPRRINSAFKSCTGYNGMIGLDAASPVGKIQRFALPFTLPA
jgi:hypothetical protein